MCEHGLIDEEKYSEKLYRAYINKGWGKSKIRFELRRKGLPDSLISQQEEEYDTEDFIDEIIRLVNKKYADKLDFSYRRSRFTESGEIILSAVIKLKKGDKAQIKSQMDELMEKRRSKQPLEYPSAGSTFKRPEGNFAGKLIMDCGLRGYQVGGAQVAEKHCGFVINKNQATAKDVSDLMKHIQQVVQKETGVLLEKEIIFLGDFE